MKYLFFFLLFFSLGGSIIQADQVEYKFQLGDYIELYVYNADELCGNFRIHADGCLWLPLIGEVPAVGKTKDELYESLHSQISIFKKNPYITIIPRFSISVIGYVKNPGVFTITDTERVIEAISKAGGFSAEASGNIEIYRNGEKIKVSRKNILDDKSALEWVKPGDIIYAKRKLISRNDYSIILSTISVISVSLYYITRN